MRRCGFSVLDVCDVIMFILYAFCTLPVLHVANLQLSKDASSIVTKLRADADRIFLKFRTPRDCRFPSRSMNQITEDTSVDERPRRTCEPFGIVVVYFLGEHCMHRRMDVSDSLYATVNYAANGQME